jgi:hypothetical protein
MQCRLGEVRACAPRAAALGCAALLLLATACAPRATIPAQPVVTPAADELEVRAAIERIFEGMHEADTAKVRSVFAPGARFAGLAAPAGAAEATVRYQEVDGWIRAIGQSGGTWEERIYDLEIHLDGNLAVAWVPYTFLQGGEISHCGVNAIMLLRAAEGWRVTQLSDTRRPPPCRER